MTLQMYDLQFPKKQKIFYFIITVISNIVLVVIVITIFNIIVMKQALQITALPKYNRSHFNYCLLNRIIQDREKSKKVSTILAKKQTIFGIEKLKLSFQTSLHRDVGKRVAGRWYRITSFFPTIISTIPILSFPDSQGNSPLPIFFFYDFLPTCPPSP